MALLLGFPPVSIPNRELVGFQPEAHPVDPGEDDEAVSIPNRELVGFQPHNNRPKSNRVTVSIPNRELVGFQQLEAL